ncbi:MAG: cytochrome b5 domain-containing protein [Minisyncoccia bacterium]|jgi:cytochrome b involved in lipid metabolism
MNSINKKFILIGIIFLILIVAGIFIYVNKQKEISSPNQIKTEKEEISPPQDQSIQSQNQEKLTQTSGEEKTEKNEKTYTMEEVAKHNSKESCWTVIRGEVYDLTNWIDKHPGGADKILKICGKDGTDLFVRQHGGKEKPEKILESFEIGTLKKEQ